MGSGRRVEPWEVGWAVRDRRGWVVAVGGVALGWVLGVSPLWLLVLGRLRDGWR